MVKSLLSELTHRSYSKAKNPDGTRTPQLRIGVEAKLPYHSFLSEWGDKYQSIMRTALNALQNGQSENDIEKSFQGKFDIDWAWADSVASDAKGTFDQLKTARDLRIKALIDIIYIKRDGNPDRCRNALSFPIPTGTTGQKQAKLRDIVCEIVKLAEIYQCPIACENLDFSTKKNQLRHSGSKEYNRMLSGFIYDKFRSYLVVRAEKYGIKILFKSPFMTSVIGMVKYMVRFVQLKPIFRGMTGVSRVICNDRVRTLNPLLIDNSLIHVGEVI